MQCTVQLYFCGSGVMGDVGLYSEVMEAGAVSHSSLARPGDLLEQNSFRWGHQPSTALPSFYS